MITIGYDVGSSSLKASLYDAATGKALAQSTYPKDEMQILSPRPGWAEQDPATWWEALKAATNELFLSTKVKPADVKAIGISYQMHGLVVVDKDLNVLRPSIIWCDSRAVEIGNQAFNAIGKEKCMSSLLNSPGNFTASKLRWVQQNEPELYSKICKMMLPGDFIAMKLTGEVNTTSEGLSEGILWDFENDEPAGFLMDYYNFDPLLLPEIKPIFGEQCRLSKAAAEETGLAAGIPVTYRAGDQPNNAFSLNVLEPGEIAATAGTSGVVYGVSGTVKYDPLNRINTFLHVNHTEQQRRLGILLCINGTGISNSWIRRNLFDMPVQYDEINNLAEGIEIGANGLSFIPFGNGAERMLQNLEPGAIFAGLNFNLHGRNHLLRAVLEGVAFSFYYGINIMKTLDVNPVVIRAGMANLFLSKTFRETIAALTNAQIQLYNTDGSLGAARGAAYGAGGHSSFSEAFNGLQCLSVVEPDQKNSDNYLAAYEKWLKELQLHIK